jgi:hypothetical protein
MFENFTETFFFLRLSFNLKSYITSQKRRKFHSRPKHAMSIFVDSWFFINSYLMI